MTANDFLGQGRIEGFKRYGDLMMVWRMVE
jgi:hypothetical protein